MTRALLIHISLQVCVHTLTHTDEVVTCAKKRNLLKSVDSGKVREVDGEEARRPG